MEETHGKQQLFEDDTQVVQEVLRASEVLETFSKDMRAKILAELVRVFGSWPAAFAIIEEAADNTVQMCLTTDPTANLLKKWKQGGRLMSHLNMRARRVLTDMLKSKGHAINKAVSAMREAGIDEEWIKENVSDAPKARADIDRKELSKAAYEIAEWCVEAAKQWPMEHAILAMRIALNMNQETAAKIWRADLKPDALSHRLRPVRERMKNDLGIGRRISFAGLEEVRTEHPEAFFGLKPGNTISPLSSTAVKEIRSLAAGDYANGNVAHWRMSIGTDFAAASWFAECANAEQPSSDSANTKAPALVDHSLKGVKARLQMAITCALDSMKPQEVAGCLDEGIATHFEAILRKTGADEGTLWLEDEKRQSLVAVYNPVKGHVIIGKSQSLASGLISLAYKMESAVIVCNAAEDERHSKKVDILTGNTTRSMIALPFPCGGERVRGVLSLVKLSKDAPEFTNADEVCAQALGKLLAMSIEHHVAQRLMA
ncbi:MAG: GAF domain-containing protein [Verrucomicrobiaceae bacterium]|nr:GAF domain-containing protein [Verrucomicrobiaceae bacterium]